jgi:hypothetical protein
LRIAGPDTASLAGFQLELNRVQPRHLIERKARRDADAESVPLMMMDGRNRLDIV